MTSEDRIELLKLAERQYGVVARWQAQALGVGRAHLRSSRFARAAAGVWRVHGSPTSWRQTVMIAVLSCGPDAAASHRTAAYLFALIDSRPAEIEVVVRQDRRREFVVHQSTDLVEGHVTSRHRIPVTTPSRTIVDMGCVAGLAATEGAVNAAVRRGLCTLEELAALVDEVGRRGRNGVGVARAVVAELAELDSVTDSWLEDRFACAVREAGIPAPERQVEITNDGRPIGRVDFAWSQALLAVELDSERHHMDRLAFRRDRERDRRLRLIGWTVLRYTAWDLRFGLGRIAGELKSMLDRVARAA